MTSNKEIENTILEFKKLLDQSTDVSDKKLLSRHVEALEKIQMSLPKYGSIRYQISSFEKLISDPWFNDRDIFEKAYYAWENFKLLFEQEIGGMTVNERLSHMGLMEEFDGAKGSESKLRIVLREVFLSPENIDTLVKKYS